jgi:quinol monooxygenase YgiN
MLYLIATLIVKPEKRADFLENARDVIAATRKEPGCQTYDLTSSITEPNEFLFVERWASREALNGHFEMPHFKHWRELCADYLEKRTLEIIEPANVETR